MMNGGVTNGGFKRCLAALPENRPKSVFFAFFLPFLPFSGGPEQHVGIPENGGQRPFPRISSDFLKPPSLKPPFVALQIMDSEHLSGSNIETQTLRDLLCHLCAADAQVWRLISRGPMSIVRFCMFTLPA